MMRGRARPFEPLAAALDVPYLLGRITTERTSGGIGQSPLVEIILAGESPANRLQDSALLLACCQVLKGSTELCAGHTISIHPRLTEIHMPAGERVSGHLVHACPACAKTSQARGRSELGEVLSEPRAPAHRAPVEVKGDGIGVEPDAGGVHVRGGRGELIRPGLTSQWTKF